jgi:hypothetical protein
MPLRSRAEAVGCMSFQVEGSDDPVSIFRSSLAHLKRSFLLSDVRVRCSGYCLRRANTNGELQVAVFTLSAYDEISNLVLAPFRLIFRDRATKELVYEPDAVGILFNTSLSQYRATSSI